MNVHFVRNSIRIRTGTPDNANKMPMQKPRAKPVQAKKPIVDAMTIQLKMRSKRGTHQMHAMNCSYRENRLVDINVHHHHAIRYVTCIGSMSLWVSTQTYIEKDIVMKSSMICEMQHLYWTLSGIQCGERWNKIISEWYKTTNLQTIAYIRILCLTKQNKPIKLNRQTIAVNWNRTWWNRNLHSVRIALFDCT